MIVGAPVVSKSGKYVFKMHFNGCAREVCIDDRLPASLTDRCFFATDRLNPRLAWPALMEKAYLKIRGGYDFPGSNSGTDLFILSGWIPEQIILKDEELDLDHLWHRVKPVHDQALVMVTLGTRDCSPEEERITGLIGEHDYAVLDLDDSTEDRKLLIKNPWKDSATWRGVGATGSAAIPHCSTPIPGTFWMSAQDLVQNFESIYLNWSPTLFRYRQDRHFRWYVDRWSQRTCHASSPQFRLYTKHKDQVWVLLSRHFADDEPSSIKSHRSLSLAEESKEHGFISIYIFLTGGTRVVIDDDPKYRGSFVDSPQALAKLDTCPGEDYTVVVCEQALPLLVYSFTLTFLSHFPIIVEKAEDVLPQVTSLHGSWTRTTAGGNSSSCHYSKNPQYRLKIPSATPVEILLQCSSPDVRVHVGLAWGGERMFTPKERDMVGASGSYRPGSNLAKISIVDPGYYTIICSTFEAHTLANYKLSIRTKCSVTLEPIPAEDAGRRTTKAPCLIFCPGEQMKQALLKVSSLTRIRAIATLEGAGPRLGIRISLILGQGPNEHLLVESENGEFGYSASGVRTPDIDLNPYHHPLGVWVRVEISGQTSSTSNINVSILSESTLTIEGWKSIDSL